LYLRYKVPDGTKEGGRPYVINEAFEGVVTTHVEIRDDGDGWKVARIPLWMLSGSASGLENLDFFVDLASGTTADFYFDWAGISPIADLSPESIAEFNSGAYGYLIGQNTVGSGWWNGANAPASEYIASGIAGADNGDALKVTVTGSSNGTASIGISIPASAEGNLTAGGNVQIRFKGAVKNDKPYFINANSETEIPMRDYCDTADDGDGWLIATIPSWIYSSNTYNLTSLDFLIDLADGVTADVLFDWIKVA
jgi:hypothetical protein